MKKIEIEICTGTACFVMGAAKLIGFAGNLPEEIRERVSIRPVLCCDLCRDWVNSKPPVVKVNGTLIGGVDEEKLLSTINNILKGEDVC